MVHLGPIAVSDTGSYFYGLNRGIAPCLVVFYDKQGACGPTDDGDITA